MAIITEETICNFERYLRENEKSDSTIEKYGTAMHKLMYWLDGEEITKVRLIEFREYLLEQGCAVSTINVALSAINAYLGLYDMSEYRIKFLKHQHSSFRPDDKELTREDYFSLVNAAREKGNHRLLLAMETICSTGIRVGELSYITMEAVRGGRADISLKGKIRTILLPKKLCGKLERYADYKNISSGEIFLCRNGSPYSRKQIWADMKALCEAAGVEPSKVFPHNLRHLFARCFYQASKDVVKLADVLGHSSIETTRIYLMSTGEEHEKTLNSLWLLPDPLGD